MSLCLNVSLYWNVRVCVILSLGICLRVFHCACLCLCMCPCAMFISMSLSLSVFECVDLLMKFMYTHEGSVSMCVCFSVSLCPYPCLCLILGSCQSMSALVLSMSLCDYVLWECMFVCVPKCLYPRAPMFVFVFVHDWIPLLE